ncbi:hypothetical protein ABER98_19835 [Domibacillus aminovorans]
MIEIKKGGSTMASMTISILVITGILQTIRLSRAEKRIASFEKKEGKSCT